jgi:transposase
MSAFKKEKALADAAAGNEPVAKGPYRRHSAQFKLQVCSEIRSGHLGRRDAQKKYKLSDNLIQNWLAKFDLQELQDQASDAHKLDAYQARIAALERKIGQLTMALDGLGRQDRTEIKRGSDLPRTPKTAS